MSNYKFYYNDNIGCSTVFLKYKGKTFSGQARLHPEDIDVKSEFTGCYYAEKRAYIEALKYERKIAKEEAECCRKFIKTCKQYKNWDNDSSMAKILYKQLNIKIKKVNKITDKINDELLQLEYDIKTRSQQVREFRKKIKNKAKEVKD